jgi:hypothetical protein
MSIRMRAGRLNQNSESRGLSWRPTQTFMESMSISRASTCTTRANLAPTSRMICTTEDVSFAVQVSAESSQLKDELDSCHSSTEFCTEFLDRLMLVESA